MTFESRQFTLRFREADLVIPELRFANCIIVVRGYTHERIERLQLVFINQDRQTIDRLCEVSVFETTSFSGIFKIIAPGSFYQKILR